MEKYTVNLCYTGYSTYEVEADNEDEAWDKAVAMESEKGLLVDLTYLERCIEMDDVCPKYEEDDYEEEVDIE